MTDADRTGPYEGDLIEISGRQTWRRYLTETTRSRAFVVTLAEARLQAANHGTALGMLWYLANPLLMAGVFLLVFGVILQVDRGVDNYPAFLVIGIFTFTYSSRLIIGCASSPRRNVRLLSTLHFPRIVFPVASALEETVAFGPAVLTMMGIAALTGESPHWTWLLTPVSLALEGLFALGVGLLFARFAFRYRDVEQLLPFLLRLWLYLSGVFYGVELVRARAGETAADLFAANPMFVFIDLNRSLILDGSLAAGDWPVAFAWTLVALAVGLLAFRPAEQEMANG